MLREGTSTRVFTVVSNYIILLYRSVNTYIYVGIITCLFFFLLLNENHSYFLKAVEIVVSSLLRLAIVIHDVC